MKREKIKHEAEDWTNCQIHNFLLQSNFDFPDKTLMLRAVLILSLIPFFCLAKQVIDVRRNITLSDSDPVYKDFYINGGNSDGFKKGQVLVVTRKVQVRDSSGTQQMGEMEVPVGELKVISVFEKVTVARELKLFDRQELPMLEQRAIMSGDNVDVKK